MRAKLWMFVAALGSVLVGLPYMLSFFGPTEAEVKEWGLVAIVVGVVLALGAVVMRPHCDRWIGVLFSLGYGGLALLQVPPIWLWFVFHGSGISDGTPPSSFVAHWVYAIPHIIVLVAALGAVYGLVYRPATQTAAHST